MWAVNNKTTYLAAATWSRDPEGVHERVVCLKATFDILATGALAAADVQEPPLMLADYLGEAGRSSLRYDADLVGAKPTTDVVVNGTAYAPGGRPATSFPIGISIAGVRKELRVVGRRMWERSALGLTPSATQPIEQLPLSYEGAYGGYDDAGPDPASHRLDTRNPIGTGMVKRAGEALPNFEYLSGDVEKAGPAGFGALDSFWSPRRELSGTYDEAWRKSRFPLLPLDWDPRSRLCSPPDQRPRAHFVGGELVELVNLTKGGRLRFVLPRLRFAFRTRFATSGRPSVEHQGQLSSVIIEPDQSRVLMVWLSVLPCRQDGDYLEETIITEVR